MWKAGKNIEIFIYVSRSLYVSEKEVVLSLLNEEGLLPIGDALNSPYLVKFIFNSVGRGQVVTRWLATFL